MDVNGNAVVKYKYDAWGQTIYSWNDPSLGYNLSTINPYRYRSYRWDSELRLYYLQSRYYNPQIGRFLNADDFNYLDPSSTHGLNLYVYCNNNPVMYSDSTGNAPEWLKWLSIGAAVLGTILVVGAITVLTMGVGTTIMVTTMAGAVLHGAAVGTLIGAGIGVVAGGIIGGAVSDWSAEGILIGMGIGFGGGALIGAIAGGATGAIQYSSAVSQWGATAKETAQQNMISHFNKHVVREGHKYLGKNVIQYTRSAKNFFNANQGLMRLTNSGNYVIRGLFEGYKAGGFFSKAGIIFSFF